MYRDFVCICCITLNYNLSAQIFGEAMPPLASDKIRLWPWPRPSFSTELIFLGTVVTLMFMRQFQFMLLIVNLCSAVFGGRFRQESRRQDTKCFPADSDVRDDGFSIRLVVETEKASVIRCMLLQLSRSPLHSLHRRVSL